jgi:hypothetical protein
MKTKWALAVVVLLCGHALFAERPRVYVTDSNSWEMGGGSSSPFGGETHGGARPQTAEIVKTFNERCPDVIINNKQEKADYIVVLEHEGGKSFILHDNKVAVFNREGDAIMSNSTRSLGNAVRDACNVIARDWPRARDRAERTRAETSKPSEKQ